ncbi:MAG TPA: hypothetical protein VHL59_06075 [Thermoanaerobaculia bacterium]|nr:hypothetical protein [Thermoanaerobaculia bacterium]
MKRLARSGAMALGALCVWVDAVACVTQLYGRNNAGSIGIVAASGVNEQWISGGIAYWDSCAESTFPALLCNQPGDYTFTVHYQPFANPGGTGCGSADPQLDWDPRQNAWVVRGGNIYLFEKDRFGFPCSNSVEARSHTVGHEIGHVLGLGDSSCTNQIMGSSTAPVHSDECAQANDQWQTPIETRIEQCQASCTTSCDGNGDCAPPPPHWDPGTDWFDPLVFDLENDGFTRRAGTGPFHSISMATAVSNGFPGSRPAMRSSGRISTATSASTMGRSCSESEPCCPTALGRGMGTRRWRFTTFPKRVVTVTVASTVKTSSGTGCVCGAIKTATESAMPARHRLFIVSA